MYRILDLDNCISDDGWRIRYIRWEHDNPELRYNDYHSLAPFDNIANEHLLATDEKIIIISSRPEMFRAATEEWLRRNGVVYTSLLLRPNGDNRHSIDLKREQVKSLPIPLSEITAAYDDRADIIGMYISLGLVAFVCAIHNIDAYNIPKG